MTRNQTRRGQAGVSLLESLLAILIFSVGILALVALQSVSVKATTDSKMRGDASFLASNIIARMWTDVPNLAAYAHNPANPGDPNCGFAGAPSANANVTGWVTAVRDALPGANASTLQIVVGANNLVAVNICWLPSGADGWRRYGTVTQINL